MVKKDKNEKKAKTTHEENEHNSIYNEMNALDFKKCFKNLMNNYKTKKGLKNDK